MASVAYVITRLINLYSTLIVIYVLMSWFSVGRSGIVFEVYKALRKLCEPWLGFFRRFIPPIGMVDISPVVAILVLSAISQLIWQLIG